MLVLCRDCRTKSYRDRSDKAVRRCAHCGSTSLVVFSSRAVLGRDRARSAGPHSGGFPSRLADPRALANRPGARPGAG